MKHSSKVQNLILCAKRVCDLNKKLSHSSALELTKLMNEIKVEDVGLTERATSTLKNVNYLHVHEEEAFTMGIFILPPRTTIPLHDHPGMTVLSRVLFGDLHVFSCDWVGNAAESKKKGGIARVRAEKQIKGPSVCTLEPERENLHSFMGGSEKGCAILDIITPPYDEDMGRSCTYYKITNRDLVVKTTSTTEDEGAVFEDETFIEIKPYHPDFDIDTYYL